MEARRTEGFVLSFGQPFLGIKRLTGVRLGPRKRCFENAAEAICKSDNQLSHEFSYVEGYAALPGEPPFHHAWIAFGNQHAVELTVKHDPLEMTFFGMPFSRFEVLKLIEKYQLYGKKAVDAEGISDSRFRRQSSPKLVMMAELDDCASSTG